MKRILNLTIAIAFILIFCISCGTKENVNTPSNSTGNDTGTSSNNNAPGTDDSTDSNTDTNTGDVNPDNPQAEEEYTFTAKILETENGLLISPGEDTNESKSSDKIVAHTTDDTKFYDKDGNEISIDKLEVGDRISVVYNGVIMESYPAQIRAISITLTEDKELLEAYKAIIDDIYQEDSGLNSDISVIALDLKDVKDLSEEELVTLVEMVKESYDIDVMKATYEELIEQGLVDEDKLYFETGILIRIIEPKYDKDAKVLTYGIEKWRSGLGAIGSNKATAKYEAGEWKITKENMWIS